MACLKGTCGGGPVKAYAAPVTMTYQAPTSPYNRPQPTVTAAQTVPTTTTYTPTTGCASSITTSGGCNRLQVAIAQPTPVVQQCGPTATVTTTFDCSNAANSGNIYGAGNEVKTVSGSNSANLIYTSTNAVSGSYKPKVTIVNTLNNAAKAVNIFWHHFQKIGYVTSFSGNITIGNTSDTNLGFLNALVNSGQRLLVEIQVPDGNPASVSGMCNAVYRPTPGQAFTNLLTSTFMTLPVIFDLSLQSAGSVGFLVDLPADIFQTVAIGTGDTLELSYFLMYSTNPIKLN